MVKTIQDTVITMHQTITFNDVTENAFITYYTLRTIIYIYFRVIRLKRWHVLQHLDKERYYIP